MRNCSGALIGRCSRGDLQPLYFLLFSSMYHKMLEIFPDFAAAGARQGTSLKCWSLQQNAGGLATIRTLSSPETMQMTMLMISFIKVIELLRVDSLVVASGLIQESFLRTPSVDFLMLFCLAQDGGSSCGSKSSK